MPLGSWPITTPRSSYRSPPPNSPPTRRRHTRRHQQGCIYSSPYLLLTLQQTGFIPDRDARTHAPRISPWASHVHPGASHVVWVELPCTQAGPNLPISQSTSGRPISWCLHSLVLWYAYCFIWHLSKYGSLCFHFPALHTVCPSVHRLYLFYIFRPLYFLLDSVSQFAM